MRIDDLYPPQRLAAAQRATARARLNGLLVAPGSDLRYLTGYHAHAQERLTCLVLPAQGEPTLRAEQVLALRAALPGATQRLAGEALRELPAEVAALREAGEDPYLVTGNRRPLEPGMAFSIEPVIYFAGRHGARIEDIVVCTADGVERLNTIPTELVNL